MVTRFVATERCETTRRAMSELRRIGGLTWTNLGQFLGVPRQRIHSCASGGTPDAVAEQHLLRVLDVVRVADRGDARSNRMVLFAIADGETPFELLASQKFEEARAILGPGRGRRLPKLIALDDPSSPSGRWRCRAGFCAQFQRSDFSSCSVSGLAGIGDVGSYRRAGRRRKPAAARYAARTAAIAFRIQTVRARSRRCRLNGAR